MASIEVDGLTIPVSMGHPALDFCNTRAGWGERVPKEYLRSHAHLAVWAGANGLVRAGRVPVLRREGERRASAAADIVARAIRFRDALYATLVGQGDLPGVNEEVRAAAATALLAPSTDRDVAPGTGWRLAPRDDLELPLLAVAWAAAELLTGPIAATVSACPGAGCGWLFSDARGRRRWCTMAICGNRAKARRHAERHRDEPRTAG